MKTLLKKTLTVALSVSLLMVCGAGVWAADAEAEQPEVAAEEDAVLLRGSYSSAPFAGTSINASLVRRGTCLIAITSVSNGNSYIKCLSVVRTSSGYESTAGWYGGEATASICGHGLVGNGTHHAQYNGNSITLYTNN